MSPTYADAASRLLELCGRFRDGQLGLHELKSEVWRASTEIVLPDEAQLRGFLQRAEGRLDMAEFTLNDDELPGALDEIVVEIETRLHGYLGSTE